MEDLAVLLGSMQFVRKRIIRVRELIISLNYNKLVEQNLIPDLKKYHNIIEKKTKPKYAPWIYQLGNSRSGPSTDDGDDFDEGKKGNKEFCYLFFGFFSEELIKYYVQVWLNSGIIPTFDDLSQVCHFFYLRILESYFPDQRPQNIDFSNPSIKSYLISLITNILNRWNYDLMKDCISNVILEIDTIQGHPDIVISHTMDSHRIILDVKTTTNFQKIATESYLQILSYFALSRAMGWDISCVGLVLPIQKDITLFDVSSWTTWPDFLSSVLFPLAKSHFEFDVVFSSMLLGSHVRKEGTLTRSILNIYSMRGPKPIQMYLSNPHNGAAAGYSPQDLQEVANLIRDRNIPYFTHASLIINLSNPRTKKSSNSNDTWALEILKKEMELTKQMCGRGITVHVGKNLKDLPQNALDIMERSIRYCLPSATKECPLLLETPAGQGTELCTEFSSMVDFYNRFTIAEREIFRITLDSCHIASAGYNPFEYISQFTSLFPNGIALVHFNDSKTPCGSRVDRHKTPGKGYIGPIILKQLHDFCIEREIPMVVE